MTNNTIDKIKTKEAEAEERIRKEKEKINTQEEGVLEKWEEKKRELFRTHEKNIKDLPQLLTKEKEEIDVELEKKYKNKKESIISKSENNLNSFKKEVLKKI